MSPMSAQFNSEADGSYSLFPTLCLSVALVPVFVPSPLHSAVWPERPSERQNHGETVWWHAAGLQRRPVPQAQADAEGLEEDVQGRPGRQNPFSRVTVCVLHVATAVARPVATWGFSKLHEHANTTSNLWNESLIQPSVEKLSLFES